MARRQARGRGGVAAPAGPWSPQRLLGAAESRRPESFREFLTNEITSDKGEPFSLQGRQVWSPVIDALEEILASRRSDQQLDVIAGAQIGKSTLMTGLAGALPARGQNVIYFLPNDVLAKRFDQTRWQPMSSRSTWLQANSHDGTGGAVDRAGLHSVAGRWVYVLGLDAITNAISIQADALVYDEADLIPKDNLDWSEDRVDASDLRLQVSISVGMLEGAGIDERFQAGCQYVWLVRCPGCRHEQVLEEEWPNCVQLVPARGGWARVCVRCGKPYDVEEAGQWVPRVPSRVAEGLLSWRIPQVIVPAVSLDGVMKKWRKARGSRRRLAKFKCSVLARPDGGDLQPITAGVLTRCRPAEPYPLSLERGSCPRFSGIDTGDAVHYVCHELLEDGRRRWVYVEEMDADSMVERISELDSALGVAARVCDAKPLRSEARRLAYLAPHTTWLLDFAGDSEEPASETAEHFDKLHQRAVVGRDAGLDHLVSLLTSDPPGALLPGGRGDDPPIIDTLNAHLRALVKERKLDARGNTIETYRRNVPNHLGLAMLSSLCAETLYLRNRAGSWSSTGRFETADLFGRGTGGHRRALALMEGY